jgi:hypothetical protein
VGLAVGLAAVSILTGPWTRETFDGASYVDWDAILLSLLKAAAGTVLLWLAWRVFCDVREQADRREARPGPHGFGYESALSEHDYAALAALAKAKGLAPPHVIGLALDEYIDRLAPEDRARYDYYAEVVRLSRSSTH